MNIIIKILLNIILIPAWIIIFVLMSLAITGIAFLGLFRKKDKKQGQYFSQRPIFDPNSK